MFDQDTTYRSLFDHLIEAVVILNRDRQIVKANLKAVAMLGCTSQDEFINHFKRLFCEDPFPLGQDTFEVCRQCAKPSGEVFSLTARVQKLVLEGKLFFQVSMADDLSDRQRMAELEDTNRRLNDIIEFLPDPTLVVDKDGKIVVWNKAIEDVTNVKKEDIIGQGDYVYALPFYNTRRPILIDWARSDNEVPIEKYAQVRREGDKLFGEIFTPSAFGGKGTYLWGVAAPLKNETGDIVGAVELMRDVTERREVEEELKTAKLAAEAATKAKSDFLANMSHEIRTPMNGIIGMAHLALQTGLNNEQQNYIQKIDSSAKSLLGIINDILDFSKIEAGKLAIEKDGFDLFRAVDRVINLIEHRVHEKGLELIVQYDPNIVRHYIGDSLRISQVLVNLMGNAVKFTEKGEVGLYIREAGKDRVQFEVKDTGIGLSAEQQASLFQSFTQADESTTRKYGGTGLGLSISKQLVGLMNGRIWVESQIGAGSRFIFEIELSKDPEKKEHFKTFDGKRVLIVDDTPTWHEVLKSTLDLFGLQVDSAHSGFEAVEMTRDCINQYDLILMDWQMPKLDGIQTTRKIKGLCGTCRQKKDCRGEPPPTVIMISSYRQDTIVRDAKEAGIDIFLQKPVNPSSLYDVLSSVFLDEIHATYNEHLQHDSLAGEIRKLTGSQILLVEDTVTNQEIVLGLLKHSGIRIDVANNGREAVAAHDKTPGKYELILMDIQMPVMDGYEASRLIRETDKAIPIIALTANAMKEDIVRTRKAGMNSHLNKPIDVEKFYETLLQYIPVKDNTARQAPPAEGAAHEEEITLPVFDAIDVDKGLKNLAGNKRLYQKILHNFKTDYAALTLDGLDDEVFKRTTHTIKGLSANIGATALHEIARRLDETGEKKLIPKFHEALAHVIGEIQGKVPAKGLPAVRADEISAGKGGELFTRLKEAIDSMQPSRYEPLIKELDQYRLPDEMNEILTRVKDALDEYDFDRATEIIAGV